MRGGLSAAIAQGCFALTRLDGASDGRYRSLHTQDLVMRKAGTGGGAHPGHPRGAAAEEEACRGCEGAGTLRRPLVTLIRGYAGQDPRVHMYALRPRRFDGMVTLEAGDQHKEEIR
jgi:hypothetical protein